MKVLRGLMEGDALAQRRVYAQAYILTTCVAEIRNFIFLLFDCGYMAAQEPL